MYKTDSYLTDLYLFTCPDCGYPCERSVYADGTVVDVCHYCGHTHVEDEKHEYDSKGYGFIQYIYHDNSVENVTIKRPLSAKEIEDVLYKINTECHDVSSFYVYKNNELVCLYGCQPKTLKEMFQEQEESDEAFYDSFQDEIYWQPQTA